MLQAKDLKPLAVVGTSLLLLHLLLLLLLSSLLFLFLVVVVFFSVFTLTVESGRLKEATKINISLSALGNVISALCREQHTSDGQGRILALA